MLLVPSFELFMVQIPMKIVNTVHQILTNAIKIVNFCMVSHTIVCSMHM